MNVGRSEDCGEPVGLDYGQILYVAPSVRWPGCLKRGCRKLYATWAASARFLWTRAQSSLVPTFTRINEGGTPKDKADIQAQVSRRAPVGTGRPAGAIILRTGRAYRNIRAVVIDQPREALEGEFPFCFLGNFEGVTRDMRSWARPVVGVR